MRNNNLERYQKYSVYSYESSGYKKLDYIVNTIDAGFAGAKCKILEIGCGIGNIARVLASFGHDVVGIDMSDDCIQRANSLKNGGNLRSVSFKKINASDIRNSFAEPFDVVICSEILEHIEKPETVLSTAYDVLGPHGLLIVTVPNGCGPFEASARLSAIVQNHRHVAELCRRLSPLLRSLSSDEVYEQSINVGEGSPHIQFFKKKALNELFQKTGFSVISSGVSDFISGAYPFSIVIRKSRLLCRLDFAVADILPSAMASGWYFTLQKDGVGLQKVAR